MQGYNVRLRCLVLTLLVHKSVFSKPLQIPPDGYIGTHSMNYLGSVEGKHLFFEYEPRRTWYEAKQACLDANMRMATITSENQAKFLNEIPYTENYTSEHFWTAGRDSQSISQFIWDTENIAVFDPGLYYTVYYPPQSCLLYMSHEVVGQYFLSSCYDAWGTLCEL